MEGGRKERWVLKGYFNCEKESSALDRSGVLVLFLI